MAKNVYLLVSDSGYRVFTNRGLIDYVLDFKAKVRTAAQAREWLKENQENVDVICLELETGSNLTGQNLGYNIKH